MSAVRRWFIAFVCAFSVSNPAGAAEEAPRYNHIHFQVERSRPVDNDRMQAVLSITTEDTNAARLADQVNRTMDWAIKIAKTRSKIESRSGGYQTYPVYDKEKIQRWRATQELLLEAPDFIEMGEVIGKLQERLQVTAITFSVSPERRTLVEDELIAKALEAFKQRADLVRKQLAAKGYRVVTVTINQGGGVPVPRSVASGAVMLAANSVAPPAVEVGTSTIGVNVNGVIELQ